MLEPIELQPANHQSFHLAEAARERLGRSSNMLRILAHSPTILRLYLESKRTFERTHGAADLRTWIAITVSQLSGSEYTLALARYEGDAQGLSREELERARRADAADPKAAAALRFAARVVRRRGRLFRDDLNRIAKTTTDLRLAIGIERGRRGAADKETQERQPPPSALSAEHHLYERNTTWSPVVP